LLGILRDLDCQVHGEEIVPGHTGSIAPPAPMADAFPASLAREQSPEASVRELLKEAARSRGFRMLVTPPESHREIGRSVAEVLGATWVSFEDAFFEEHGGALGVLERAERFKAQRAGLTEAAEATFARLVEEHGRPGQRIVLGDTALLGLCGALDLPRRRMTRRCRAAKLWVLVVPGVIHNRQPLFNEGRPSGIWGATFPLNARCPRSAHESGGAPS
jgi:hypothetical protein